MGRGGGVGEGNKGSTCRLSVNISLLRRLSVNLSQYFCR